MYPGNKRKKLWGGGTERLLKMTLEERRKEYLGEYVALKTIPTWMEDLKSKSESDGENAKEDLQGKKSLSEKVSLYRGDITLLEVDAIVNADYFQLVGLDFSGCFCLFMPSQVASSSGTWAAFELRHRSKVLPNMFSKLPGGVPR
uniref:Mono-ADP ribosylhydrolase 2 n=1 Tax=Ficedula albicollis TaxID=59894 RepID=A0A803WAL1_FICAL